MNRIIKTLVSVAIFCMGLVSVSVMSSILTSCSKEGVSIFKGNWSYKISGSAVIDASSDNPDEQNNKSMSVALITESGQMDILVADKRYDIMKVTMSAMRGDVVQADATAQGKDLILKPFRKRVVFKNEENVRISADVTVSGTAQRFDDVIIFDLKYEGDCSHLGQIYYIKESQVSCVAKLNDF